MCVVCFFFQAEDGIRDLVRSRGLGDVYKRQAYVNPVIAVALGAWLARERFGGQELLAMGVILLGVVAITLAKACLLYTSPSPRDRTRSRMPSSA